jgi:hypothetical protein
MPKFKQGDIVRHRTGHVCGVVENVFEVEGKATGYYIEWDDGTYSTHSEKDIEWSAISRPQVYKKLA